MALILLIEDDKDLAETLSNMLEAQGHEVHAIEDGSQWEQSLTSHAIDLVISDMFMPVKDGIETIREIRQAGYEIPILAISGGSTTSTFDAISLAKRFGASDILRKPISYDTLETKLRTLLDSAQP